MSKARQLADLGGDTANLEDISSVLSSGQLGNRNLIINGAMQVAQRGTSFSSAGYTLDRWTVGSSGYNITQSTDVPADQGFTYSLSSNRTSATSHFITTTVELPKTGDAGLFYNGSKLTLSAWVKGVSGSTITATCRFRIGSGGTAGTSFSRTQDPITLTGSWQYIVINFDVDQNVGASDTALQMFWTYAGQATNETFYFTGVQLETGDTATPFEHRSYGQELALCQRYFFKLNAEGASTYAVIAGSGWTTAYSYAPYPFPVTMRSTPSFTLGGSIGNLIVMTNATQVAATSISFAGGSNKDNAELEIQHGSVVATNSRWIRLTSGSSFSFDAEL